MAENHSFLHRLLNWNKKNTPETVDAEQYAEAFGQFKKLLLEQYRIRIQAKTAKRLPINLSAKPTHFGTSPERAALYFNDLTIESEDIATEISKILNTHNRLLLIGDPGAGKTTILLYAAINILLFSAESKLPLLLNLATWQKKIAYWDLENGDFIDYNSTENNFAHWYTESITNTYNLSPIFVQELLQRNAIVPFFDGFDEIAKDSREDCFHKMAAYFGGQRNRQLIISSRKIEYAEVNSNAPVYVEIEVQPLSLSQVQKSLYSNGQVIASDLALMYALDLDQNLAKAVQTPFYLNTASFLFEKSERTIFDFLFKAKDVEGRQEELVETFIKEQVQEERIRKYLCFLAGKMKEEEFLVFDLLSMQPRWCKSLWRYLLASGVVSGIVFGLVGGMLIYLFGDLDVGWIKNFGLTLFMSLIIGSFVFLLFVLSRIIEGDLSNAEIRVRDIQVWRWWSVVKNLKEPWPIVMIVVAIASWWEGSLGAVAFAIWLFIGLFIRTGMTMNLSYHILSPYQRFWNTLQNNFWIIFFLMSFFPLVILAEPIWEKGLSLGMQSAWDQTENPTLTLIIYGLLFALFLFFSSKIPRHFALRFILYLENKLPLRLVTFLDQMTDQHIFEDTRCTINGKKQRGATWRFRYKIFNDSRCDSKSHLECMALEGY